MANTYGNLGIVHKTRGELDDAVSMYQQALAIYEELGSKEGMANTYGNLGNVHKTRGELDEARKVWVESIRLFDELNSPDAEKARDFLSQLDT